MEDALVPKKLGGLDGRPEVLILVLMEDALVLDETKPEETITSRLNPCFNGRCTRTAKLG